ncbi:MAG: lamin tail domain-containing protein, partial [Candidatus Pacebacteria bacterium]|nr:lamin tail domain-containing protein [Candidatus Paceibacterota bacterium]
MNIKNLFYSVLLVSLLASFFIVPVNVFAIDFNFFNFDKQDDYQVLSELESKRIMQKFSKILNNRWLGMESDAYSDPMEKSTVLLLREIIRCDLWNYILGELPVNVSVNIARQSLDIARLIGAEDVSGLIGKFETETVNLAVKYAKEYLLKNELKVSFGAMEVKYGSGSNKVDSQLQYIMMYKPIDDKKGRVVTRIYSPKAITPPASRGSIGMAMGFLNDLPDGKNISPFIVEISGIIEKTELRDYRWSGNPSIAVNFPSNVPDFGLRPRTWQDKYVMEPIKKTLDNISNVFSFLIPKGEIAEYVIKDGKNVEAINEAVKEMEQGKTIAEEIAKEKETIKQEKEIVKPKPVPVEEKKEEIKKEEVKKEEIKKEDPIQCSKYSSLASVKTMVINEVAWMGSKASSNDEWIELKNVSDKNIDLKGWRLSDKGDQINIVFESLIVPQGGFVLLERTDDNAVPFIPADVIYSGALSNSEEAIYLFDSSCALQDSVLANPDWPAGNNSEKRTMERGADFSWHDYSGNGTQNIFGTPKQENSAGKVLEKKAVTTTTTASVNFNVGGGPVAPVITYCSQTGLIEPSHSPIIINEVAWMGTSTSSSDEWIELKNVSSESINLNNWQLLDNDNQIKVVFSSTDIIPANGYYLLERTDDESVPNVIADKIYVGALSDTNESLRLFNNNCVLIDDALASSDWPAGNNSEKRTMERGADFSWHDYSGDGTQNIFGTPKQENSDEEVQEEEEVIVDTSDDSEPVEPVINYCSQLDLSSPSFSPVLINEVAWMGTSTNSSNEWIELKNVSAEEVNLKDWQLLDKDNQIKVVFSSTDTISVNSFYLLERTDDESVPNVIADKIYTGALSDTDESLRLFNSTCVL